MTLGAYRDGGRGSHIRFAVAESALGYLLVAATEHGICEVRLGKSRGVLEDGMRAEYPDARIEAESSGLAEWIEAVLDLVDGQSPNPHLPLDIRGTAFERLVWQELQRIPYGETRSYGEIAEAVGNPRAARAVGRACAANPVPVVIPCHRVVQKDGSAGGYRWGTKLKTSLLEHEKREASRARTRPGPK